MINAAVWTAVGSLFWTSVLLIDLVSGAGFAHITGKNVIRFIAIAFQWTVVASAVTGLLHLLTRWIRLTRFSRFRLPISMATATVLSSYPLFRLTESLTEGDWISGRSWVLAFQIALFIAGLVAVAAIWFFHVLLILDLEDISFRPVAFLVRTVKRPVVRAALIISALAASAAGLVFNELYLSNYMHLSIHLITVMWFAGSTALFSLFAMFPLRRKIVFIGCAVWICASVAVSVRYRSFHNTGGSGNDRLASLTALIMGVKGNDTARFDVSNLNSGLCKSRPKVSRPPKWPLPEDKRKNVILISLEAVRKDAVGKRINGKEVTPNLNVLRKEAVYFNHAFATYPATIFSVGGVLTGYLPSEILFAKKLPKNVFTSAKKRFGSLEVFLPKNMWFSMPIISALFIQRAEAHYDTQTATQINRMIQYLKRQRQSNKPTFTWAHLFDPHQPYTHRSEFRFGTGKKNDYFSEVAYTDRLLGKLLTYLKDDGWYKDTLVVVFADHGQALGERNYFGHHVFLTDWLTDVPLFIRAPDLSPKIVQHTVSLVDIAPTVMHFLDMPARDMTGSSLLTQMDDTGADDFAVAEAFPMRGKQLFQFAKSRLTNLSGLAKRIDQIEKSIGSYSPKAAVIQGDWRLIVDRMTDQRELYNSKKDPENTHNLYNEKTTKGADLEWIMRDWHKKMSSKIYCRVVGSQ